MKTIRDRIPLPPGALPARAQTWLLLAVTGALAIALLAFPGQADKPPAARSGVAGTPAGPGSAPAPVGAVEQAAARLRADAAREAERRLRAQLGAPSPRPDGLPQAPAPLARPAPAVYAYPEPTAEDELEREERLRRYRSLRAPSVVQSHRPALRPEAAPGAPPASAAPLPPSAPPAAGPAPETSPEPAAPSGSEALHVLREGEFIEAVLTNRLDGALPGPVNALVSAPVYDRARRHVLIPRGARALGSAKPVADWAQNRLAVAFHRLILPNGASVDLDTFPGLNQVGETGLRDRVNRHYASAFGAAGAIGALAGLTQAVSPQEALFSRLGSARLAAGTGLSRAAERMLERYLNRLPRITIREGHRLRIYLTADLALPAYRAARRTGGQP